jgi:hypothetical protein
MVAEREELPASGRLAAEDVLRNQPVQADDCRVARGEHVCGLDGRKTAHVPRDHEQRDEDERLLPRGDDVERRSAHAEVPQLRHRRVVDDQSDDQNACRDPDEPARANRRSPPG